MSDRSAERIGALEKQLEDLQGENEILIERAEDILLLGLVTEAISRQVEPAEIMATVLERISILKDVPYCALVQLDGDEAFLVQEYTVLRDEPPGEVLFRISPLVVDEIQQGATMIPNTDISGLWASLGFPASDSKPESAMLVPFMTTHHNHAALLLADTARRREILAALLPLIEQVTRAATARIENASLFRELEELTENLNRVVRERTAALTRTNERLELEAAERRRAEENLRLAATVFDSSHDAIVITSPLSTILAVNPAFCRITGYSEEEILGRKARILVSERHDPGFIREMLTAIEETGGWRGEIWSRRKTGEACRELLSITGVRDAEEKLTHYFGIFADLDE